MNCFTHLLYNSPYLIQHDVRRVSSFHVPWDLICAASVLMDAIRRVPAVHWLTMERAIPTLNSS